MQAWAEECLNSWKEIESVAECVHALGWRLPGLGFGSNFYDERHDPFSQHSGHPGPVKYRDPVEILDGFGEATSLKKQETQCHGVPVDWEGHTNSPGELDPGPYTLNTPVLCGSRYMVNQGYGRHSCFQLAKCHSKFSSVS